MWPRRTYRPKRNKGSLNACVFKTQPLGSKNKLKPSIAPKVTGSEQDHWQSSSFIVSQETSKFPSSVQSGMDLSPKWVFFFSVRDNLAKIIDHTELRKWRYKTKRKKIETHHRGWLSWYRVVSLGLPTLHTGVPGFDLHLSFWFRFLLMCTLNVHNYGSNTWVLVTHVGDLESFGLAWPWLLQTLKTFSK